MPPPHWPRSPAKRAPLPTTQPLPARRRALPTSAPPPLSPKHSWPALWNKVEQRGRIPSHTFLDYATTYLVVAVATALTFGQLGPDGDPPRNFLAQLRQPNGRAVAFAVAGGATLAVGDVAMQYTTALLGLSIGPVRRRAGARPQWEAAPTVRPRASERRPFPNARSLPQPLPLPLQP